MSNSSFVCCICGRTVTGEWGNNPEPVNNAPDARCCDDCDVRYVIPERIRRLTNPIPLKHSLK